MKLTKLLRRGFADKFKKFDYTDALNMKSLLTEEEIMVYGLFDEGHGKC
jgi:hypothetical protein